MQVLCIVTLTRRTVPEEKLLLGLVSPHFDSYALGALHSVLTCPCCAVSFFLETQVPPKNTLGKKPVESHSRGAHLKLSTCLEHTGWKHIFWNVSGVGQVGFYIKKNPGCSPTDVSLCSLPPKVYWDTKGDKVRKGEGKLGLVLLKGRDYLLGYLHVCCA